MTRASTRPEVKAPADQCTRSNYQDVRVKHIKFNWSLDWASRCLSGTVTYSIIPARRDVDCFILDVKHLDIHTVATRLLSKRVSPFRPAQWYIDPTTGTLGDALHIPIKRGPQFVKISYSTLDKCSALQWCESQQMEYVYTHNWCLGARQLFPCQDTTGAKAPFDVSFNMPRRRNRVLMSACRQHDVCTSSGRRIAKFRQATPVPPYLVCFAVGPWSLKRFGRVSVWSLPNHGLELFRKDVAGIGSDLERAEQLVGPLPWRTLEFLQLPKFGSHLESPQLIYIFRGVQPYPSRRQIAVHEMAHQWFGNWVTPARWRDLWLSEGLATFLERALAAHFEPKLDEYMVGEKKNLVRVTSKLRRRGRARLACLCCENLGKEDPDKVLDESDYIVPYEKGFLLLCALRDRVGSDDLWKFLRQYLHRFGGGTASSEDFVMLWKEAFPGTAVNWRSWLHGSKLPSSAAAKRISACELDERPLKVSKRR